jgi:hypothetical protein
MGEDEQDVAGIAQHCREQERDRCERQPGRVAKSAQHFLGPLENDDRASGRGGRDGEDRPSERLERLVVCDRYRGAHQDSCLAAAVDPLITDGRWQISAIEGARFQGLPQACQQSGERGGQPRLELGQGRIRRVWLDSRECRRQASRTGRHRGVVEDRAKFRKRSAALFRTDGGGRFRRVQRWAQVEGQEID